MTRGALGREAHGHDPTDPEPPPVMTTDRSAKR